MEGNPSSFWKALDRFLCGRCNAAYVYLRGEFWQLGAFLDEKIAEMEKDGILGDKLFGGEYSCASTHLGAGAYICGEETALLESLEGKAASRVSARRSRLRLVYMESRPSSTTWRPLPMCR